MHPGRKPGHPDVRSHESKKQKKRKVKKSARQNIDEEK